MASIITEIVITAEVRPAIYSRLAKDGKWYEENVLVHMTKTSKHGGYLVEDIDGFLFEVVVDENFKLRFLDGLHKQYCFDQPKQKAVK